MFRFLTKTLLIASIALASASPVLAQSDPFTINFGLPTGHAPGDPAYDREFIKDWEMNPPRGFPTVSKANIEPTKLAIARYEKIVAQGGFRPVPDVAMQLGGSGPSVDALRERLFASGDLKTQSSFGGGYDYNLEKAVKRFQASNGLSPTGITDKRTIAALNVPAAARLSQLKTNLQRLQGLIGDMGKKYVLVNIPSAQVEAVHNDRIVERFTGVVGKVDRPTPILKSTITDFNFNPVWNLPPTVIEKDLIPRGREMQASGVNVLVKYGIDAYDGSGKKVDPTNINWKSVGPDTYAYKQQPGKENPLGFVKLNFPNGHSVYMHDTPSETIFGKNFRAASSGCIRVQGIKHLVAWILSADQGWSLDRVEKMKESGERLDVRLKKPVPLHFVYLTAWATADAVVNFRRDLYMRDGVGEVAAAY